MMSHVRQIRCAPFYRLIRNWKSVFFLQRRRGIPAKSQVKRRFRVDLCFQIRRVLVHEKK